jgi:predicted dehydrogenase
MKEKFNPKDAYFSIDEMCKSDLDAIVVITQPWLHAPQCVQAMESGKHVYSAVPIISIPDGDETLEWCDRIINVSRITGQRYMLGETTYFHPESMFCRKKAQEGAFGDFVYAEGEYFHDVDLGCSLREVVRKRTSSSSGKEWLDNKREYLEKGIKTGPMHYPTHSTSGPVAVMGGHAVKVSARGYRNRNNDPFFEDYAFSNEVALFQMSNGASVRIIEFREIAGSIADNETFRIFGTKGSYAENKWMENGRELPPAPKALEKTEITDEEMRDALPAEVVEAFKKAMNKDAENLQDIDFVPRGHKGSHPYLVHEFVDAVASNRQPAINAWEAARYMAMGVMAHKSALKDGEILDVPDWGEAPV